MAEVPKATAPDTAKILLFICINFHACLHVRGWFDNIFVSRPDIATITREIYFFVVHSLTWLPAKFQPNRARSYVSNSCERGRVCGF